MVMRTENEKLFLVIIPISPETTEYRGSIIHGVSKHTEFHVRVGNDAALMKHKIWQRHVFHLVSILTPDIRPAQRNSRSVYHTNRLWGGARVDLEGQQAYETNERCGKVERHSVADSLK